MKGLSTVLKSFAAGAVALSVLAAGGVTAQAAEVNIRIQSVISAKADEVTMLKNFAADVLALTADDPVTIEVLPAGAVVGLVSVDSGGRAVVAESRDRERVVGQGHIAAELIVH